jgi:hypothetical protein
VKIKATPSAVIVPRWLWFAYFSMVIIGADRWPDAVGGVLMLIVGLRKRPIDGCPPPGEWLGADDAR